MAHLLLYGGTFDPIHHGHLITCQRAREILGAEQVLFIPAGISPHKLADVASASAEHRLTMLRLAIANNPRFGVDPRELSRQGPSYTFDTVVQIRKERPGDSFTWLLGADQLPKLHTWHRIAELMRMIQLAVLPRPSHLAALPACQLNDPPPSVATPLLEISSTDIRQRVANSLSIEYLVPAPVADYIRQHQLYSSKS